jgi:hypothetical protein
MSIRDMADFSPTGKRNVVKAAMIMASASPLQRVINALVEEKNQIFDKEIRERAMIYDLGGKRHNTGRYKNK